MKIYRLITAKRILEELLMAPFVLMGRIYARFKPLEYEYDIFMFFPIYGIGGAEKVNGAIVESVKHKKIVIFFTRKSPDDKLLHLFELPGIQIFDISKYTDNKLLYLANFFWRGVCAEYINRQRVSPVVLNGQCNFAYKLFPHIRRNIFKVEVIHNSEWKFNSITFPYIPFIDQRVTITDNIRQDIIEYYRKLGVNENLGSRLTTIYNAVPVPENVPHKNARLPLKVLYAGRGGKQKRLHLIFQIVETALEKQLPVEFHFAGSFKEEIPSALLTKIFWHGAVSDAKEMYQLYENSDVLLMTSAFEGFPMVIMEAMSNGLAIISTAVNSIPDHIKDGENGFLIFDDDEDSIVLKGVQLLGYICDNPEILKKMAINNHYYIKSHFSQGIFRDSYRRILDR